MITSEKLKKECSEFYKLGYKLGYRDGVADKPKLNDAEIKEIIEDVQSQNSESSKAIDKT